MTPGRERAAEADEYVGEEPLNVPRGIGTGHVECVDFFSLILFFVHIRLYV